MSVEEGVSLEANRLHFREVLEGMQDAAERREQLLAGLTTLCKALALDIRHIGIESLPGGDSGSRTLGHLSAPEVRQQLCLAHTQEEADCENARFVRRLILSRESTPHDGDEMEPATRGSLSLSLPSPPRLFSAVPGGSGLSAGEQPGNSRRGMSGDFFRVPDGRSRQSHLPQHRSTSTLANDSGGESIKGGWKSCLHEMIRRRDALQDDVASLRCENERAAVRQHLLQRDLHQLTCAARVAVVERDAFATMRELFDALLTAGEEWLELLNRMERIVLAPSDEAGQQPAVEAELRGEIGRMQEMRRAVFLARQAVERRQSLTLAEVASLHSQQHLQQVMRERRSSANRMLLLSLRRLENSTAAVEAQQTLLRQQYAGRCLALAQLDNLGYATFMRHVLLAPPGIDRMNRTFLVLRSVLVNYEIDLSKIKHVSEFRREMMTTGVFPGVAQLFKKMLLEIKTLVAPYTVCSDETLALELGAETLRSSTLTLEKLRQFFPSQLAEPVHHLLLALAALWEYLTPAEQQGVYEGVGDMASSAHMLLVLAYHVEARRRRRYMKRWLSHNGSLRSCCTTGGM